MADGASGAEVFDAICVKDLVQGARVITGAGTAAAPSIVASTETNTGFYFSTNAINFAIAGVVKSQQTTDGIRTAMVYPLSSPASFSIKGLVTTSGTAIANKIGNNSSITGGDAIVVFYSDAFSTEEARIRSDGSYIQDGLIRVAYSGTLADDATITLVTGVAGILRVWTDAVWMTVHVNVDGTVSVAGTNSGSSDIADTDGRLCVYDGGTGAVIKNRLGAPATVRYTYEYS